MQEATVQSAVTIDGLDDARELGAPRHRVNDDLVVEQVCRFGLAVAQPVELDADVLRVPSAQLVIALAPDDTLV